MNPLHEDRSNPLYEACDFETSVMDVPVRSSYSSSQFGRRFFASEEQAETKRRAGVNLIVQGSILALVLGCLFGGFVRFVVF